MVYKKGGLKNGPQKWRSVERKFLPCPNYFGVLATALAMQTLIAAFWDLFKNSTVSHSF